MFGLPRGEGRSLPQRVLRYGAGISGDKLITRDDKTGWAVQTAAAMVSLNADSAKLTLDAGNIQFQGRVLLSGLDPSLSAEVAEHGLFLTAEVEKAQARMTLSAGGIPELHRYTVSHRFEPFWMKPAAGSHLQQVPAETQFFLAQLAGGGWLLLVPMFGEKIRFSLQGHPEDRLELLGETGDPFCLAKDGLALFVAFGEEPFALLKSSAPVVQARLGKGKLRVEKQVPQFVEHFGWCTWNAFYQDVSADQLLEGLSSFATGGVCPRFVILDDGWQATQRMETGERRLTSLSANEKFDGDLSASVTAAKEGFGVETFFVGHSMVGYWGGVDPAGLSEYNVVDQVRRFGEGILSHEPRMNDNWGASVVGLIPEEKIGQFFEDYHSELARQGVDGIKVDNQSVLEGLAVGHGGGLGLSRGYREALEASAEKHFEGRLLNCMAGAADSWYAGQSLLSRSSRDFIPLQPDAHGMHLYSNAQVSLWFGNFMQPDWDMFQSGHIWGAYHAAARALSGGPVYVSDRPNEHDFLLLSKLVCSDGSILRADQPALPTADTLCVDPTHEDALLKIWNRNGNAGVLGVFHARRNSQPASGVVRVADVPGLQGERFACFAHEANSLEVLEPVIERVLSLADRGFEVFTFVPVERGLAVIGLADKFNSAAAVENLEWPEENRCCFGLKDGGQLLLWCQVSPTKVEASGESLAFRQVTKGDGVEIRVAITAHQASDISIVW